jgi:cytochrome c oxidase subunit 3
VNATAVDRTGRRLPTAIATLLLVLGTETVLFGTLLMAYLYMRAANPAWPGIPLTAARMAVPGGALLILIASEGALWHAWRQLRRGTGEGSLRRWLSASLGLGLLFLAGQVLEFTSSGMRADDRAFGGVFLTLMAFHGLHVVAGIVLQSFNYVRAGWGDFDAEHHTAIDVGFFFWTYVVAIWLVLFIALYLT